MREIDTNHAVPIHWIKNSSNKVYDEHPMSYHKLLTELIKDSAYEINYSTLKNTLNVESYALDMCTVLAICRYWHLDVSCILSPPSATGMTMPAAEQFVTNGKFTILDDSKYFGTFHGYMYTRNPQHNVIFKFELLPFVNGTSPHLLSSHCIEHLKIWMKPSLMTHVYSWVHPFINLTVPMYSSF